MRRRAAFVMLALGVAAGPLSAQSDATLGILTGEERAQYEASLAFCSEDPNRDTIRCKRFQRAYPGVLPPRQPAPEVVDEAATAED